MTESCKYCGVCKSECVCGPVAAGDFLMNYTPAMEAAENAKKKSGRPAKSYVNFHCQIPLDVKTFVDRYADLFNVSQGEVVSLAVELLKAAGGKRK